MDPTEQSDEPFGSYLPIELWLNILKYATECDLERSLLDCMLRSGPDPLEIGRLPFEQLCDAWDAKIVRRRLDYPTRLNLVLVSRTWHELMLPMLYHSTVLVKSPQLKSFTILLRNKPHLRGLVKVLGVDRKTASWGDRDHIGRATEDQSRIQEIYKYCANLTVMDDFAHHGDIWSLGEEVNRGRKLQYLLIGINLLLNHAELYRTLSSFDYLQFLVFDFGTASVITISHASRLTLPRLEVLSLSTNHTYTEEIDRYFGEAELPRLHTLQLRLQTRSPYSLQIHELDRFQEIWRWHGTRINTLQIWDQTAMRALRRDQTPPTLSFKLNRHLVNLQQLIFNGDIWETFLMELGTCSSITTLEISHADRARATQIAIADVERLFREDVCEWFDNLQWLRISVAPDLYGRELMKRHTLDDLERAIERYRASIEARGVEIVSEIQTLSGY